MLFLLRRLILITATILAIPLLIVLTATLIVFNLLARMSRLLNRPPAVESKPLSGLASIIILNWDGKDLLAEGLPTVLEAVREDRRPHEVIVVDNGSTDGSLQYVAENFPEVRTVALSGNHGFAAGNNAG